MNYCTNHRPCKNGGVCHNTGQGSYTCSCPVGYAGADCSKKADSCYCENGGTCNANSECECLAEFGGARCEVRIGCSNCGNGICNGGLCICPMGTYGPYCDILFCSLNPCQNNGICHENNKTCTCLGPYSGQYCSNCACVNGGTCNENADDPADQCNCPAEYTGKLCNLPNATYTLGMLKNFEEELTYEHVILVIIASVATPLLIITAISILLILKRRKYKENQRLNKLAKLQNEENIQTNYRKGISTSNTDLNLVYNLNSLHSNVKKDSNIWNDNSGGSSANGGGNNNMQSKIYEKGGSGGAGPGGG